MKTKVWSVPRFGIFLVALVATSLMTLLAAPAPAAAYPFWAQQNYETPREPTGRIVCANCHLGAKPTEIEVPQSVLPDTVFKAVVKIPYDTNVQQVVSTGEKGPLNVGAVLMLPEGFKLAPEDRIPEDMKEEVGPSYIFQNYSDTQDNIIIVGPLPGDQYQEIVFPVLSPDPGTNKAISFGKYSVHVGGNRGRGQVYPTGEKSNNAVYNASAAGTITNIASVESGYEVTIQSEAGDTVVDKIPAGPALIVSEGDAVTAGSALTSDPNVGGFGQKDAEIVLQNPNRIKGLLAFLGAVMITQIMLVLKKKQVEKVQAAEMTF
ncbi:MAG: apocytochrome f [Synechococcales cyanobacterium T60_A2020_003]|nr:apocytochrome f [Synechococcales cyanobacterium T60_A2020_003]